MFTYQLNIQAICKGIKYATVAIALSSTSFLHASETSNTDAAATESQQDIINRGKEKSVTCAACHGADGVAVIPGYPNLAAQVPGYIASQLALYKSGERKNAIMAGQAAGLSEQDMADLDAYFSSLDATKSIAIIDESNEEAVAQAILGQTLYRGGNKEANIPSCMSCHGPTGAGIPAQYPRLANQPAAYIEEQLLAYKSGDRQNAIMNDIAFKLSATQIKALASFIASIEDNRSE